MFYRLFTHHNQFRYLGAFYIHSLIRLLAVSLFQIFSSIYVFFIMKDLGVGDAQALGATSLFFALIYLVNALAIAPSIWIISKRGLRFSVFWGNVFLIVFFAFLYLAKFDPIFLVISAVCGGIQVGLYWTSYHIYLSQLTDDNKQGEEVAISQSLSAFVTIGGPAFGGLLISFSGFESIFIVMSLLILLANLPLRYLPKNRDIISVDILKTVSVLAPKQEQKSYLALFGDGVIGTVAGYFWPLAVFPILSGYVGLGFIGSLMALFATFTVLIVGLLIDKYGPRKVINLMSILDSILWVFRAFASTPIRVYVASVGQAFATAGQLLTIDSMVYERARHNNLIAFIAQREVGLSVGQFIFLFVVGILFWFGMPLFVIFLFAAVGALLTRFYPEEMMAYQSKQILQLPRSLKILLQQLKVKYMKILVSVSLLLILVLLPSDTDARRITPEDIYNNQKDIYQQKLVTYSTANQNKSTIVLDKLEQINKNGTDHLNIIIVAQAEILDEFERRYPDKYQSDVENVRYWITYAHEAVAYQAAKKYLPTLSYEPSLSRDLLAVISVTSQELSSTRTKVLNSQKLLSKLVKKYD